MRSGDEVLIDLQTTELTLGEVIERIESLRHSPRMAGHHITIDGDARAVVLSRMTVDGDSLRISVLDAQRRLWCGFAPRTWREIEQDMLQESAQRC